MQQQEVILILDFGSQYTQLIARRIREKNIYSEIHPYNLSIEKIKELNPAAIILSGGPTSVYDDDAPTIDSQIYDLGIPILGICYGLQITAKLLGGKIEPAEDREYGKTKIHLGTNSKLFKDVSNNSVVWMSHGDIVTKPPANFHIDASTDNSPICAISNPTKKIYGVQFHPEVYHTVDGEKILHNFLFNICECRRNWNSTNFIENSIKKIREEVGGKKALCALSGGVDSSVAAILVDNAIGENLICVHVNTGLMRFNESEEIIEIFKKHYNLNLRYIDASEIFLTKLKGVTNPEEKRKIIGKTFIEIFEKEASNIKDIKFLVQGTLYPDVIESIPVKGFSATIKSHHNVGGLPEKMNLKLIEPFRELFKDEVRNIGKELGLAESFIERHPFPGPGLAIRIIGEINKERLSILRRADKIFIDEIKKAGIYNQIWQAFVVLLPIRTVGVMGDSRTYENVVSLRAVTSVDGMTADWFRFDYDFLENVSNKIIRNVSGINRVVYDISSKPPSTIEWE